MGLKGNPVRIRSGPAAVIGYEIRRCHFSVNEADREGAESRAIRKSEDLPKTDSHFPAMSQDAGKSAPRAKKTGCSPSIKRNWRALLFRDVVRISEVYTGVCGSNADGLKTQCKTA